MSDQDMLGGLKSQLGDYAQALGRKAINSVSDRVDDFAERIESGGGAAGEGVKAGAEKMAEGKSPVSAAASGVASGAQAKVKDALPGGSGSSSSSSGKKFINIVEWTDIGVPLHVAYNAFTQFEDWPTFMRKVENVERVDDTKISFKGQVFLSHRTWEATITEQVADSHIVWSSTGEKGSISGSVSFHEVTPTLTRMLTIGEYHPQGFVERTGNLWRAVGRRFRLELKFFVHHVMTEVIQDPDSVEGWRGEIRDGELVQSHEEAVEQEQEAASEAAEDESAESEQDTAPEDEGGEEDVPAEESEEQYAEEEPEDVDEEPAPEDEAEPEDVEEEPAPEDEAEPEEEAAPEDVEEEPAAEEDDAPAEDEEDVEPAEEEAPAEEED